MKLQDSVSDVPGIGPAYVGRLKKLGVETIEDLLYHIPFRYSDFTNASSIAELQVGETVTIVGEITSINNVYTKSGKVLQVAKVQDDTGSIEVIWMRQPFLIRTLPPGTLVSLSGNVGFWGKKRAISFPQYEKLSEGGVSLHTGGFVSRYSETEGVSSKWLRTKIHSILESIEDFEDFIPDIDKDEQKLMGLTDALRAIHKPTLESDSELARHRLAFDELLLLQIENNLEKIRWERQYHAHKLVIDDHVISAFIHALPYELTASQVRSLEEIIRDFKNPYPMNRLLEGDVGSGKTSVAAGGIFVAAQNNKQSVLMAPTQILAQQHYQTLSRLLSPFRIRVGLVTGEAVEQNDQNVDVYVGTHALLFRESLFENCAFSVIDEQHRFGVKQRARLSTNSKNHPHVLTMTATPIPRTVALTLYGDLELSTLDELPKGRQKITTWVVPPKKRKEAERWIAEQITKHKVQVFVVCPIIEESDKEIMKQVKAVKSEFERLKKVFTKQKVGLLHGRMKAKEKDKILTEFKNKKLDILVSTPVIEVGIDIPNATIMVIEAAERFGLAQLHQLRGRVGRSEKKSYCLLFTEPDKVVIVNLKLLIGVILI